MKRFWRLPTYTEVTLLIVIVILAGAMYKTDQRIDNLTTTMESMGMSDDVVTTHMVQSNMKSFRLIERIELLEEMRFAQTSFNDHILEHLTSQKAMASW